MRNPDLLFCKAVDANGDQVFSVMVSRESPFDPRRSQRAEASNINGQNTWWYRTEIATRPNLLAREAIRDTMAKYNTSGDRLKAEDFAACFTEDGIIESERVAGDKTFFLDLPDEVEQLLGAAHRKAGDDHIAAPVERPL